MTFEPDSAHRGHDPMLIAGHASNDLAPSDAERVERWLRDCSSCAAMRVDLVALSRALATMPKTATAPRDFRLSPAQAARLRGGPWWRRLGRALAAPRGIGRPLATAFTTLGLVGLLVGSLPIGALLLAPTGERAFTEATPQAAGSPVPAGAPSPPGEALGPIEDRAGSGDDRGGYTLGSGSPGDGGTTNDQTKDVATSAPPGQDLAPGVDGTGGRDAGAPTVRPVLALAFGFLGIGLALFAFRRFGGRLA